MKWRSDLGVSPNYSPWTSHAGFKGLGLPTGQGRKRVIDLIDLTAMQICKRAKLSPRCGKTAMKQILKDSLVDVSQSHARPSFSNSDGTARCLCTGSELYSFRQDRIVHPRRHLMLQGHPESVIAPNGFTNSDLRAIAGESIALPCLGCLIWAIITTIGFPHAVHQESSSSPSLGN